MGGSFASSGSEASVFARFHFRPHFHQHAGFRLVAPDQKEEAQNFVTSCMGRFLKTGLHEYDMSLTYHSSLWDCAIFQAAVLSVKSISV